MAKAGRRRVLRRTLAAWAAAGAALIIAAPSALAGTESIRFDFDPSNPNKVHEWTAPEGVTSIEVEVAGGGGGAGREAGGRGALVRAQVEVVGGTTFDIGVGGGGGRNNHAGGGGGASIVQSPDVLIIAGGGGGGSSISGNAGGRGAHNLDNGAGQSGGGGTGAFGGGDRGRNGTGGHGGTARGPNGQNYNAETRTGGSGGGGAEVGGAGGAGSSSGGGGGGAGYGGGQAGGSFGGGGAGGSTAQGTGVTMVDGATSFYSRAGGAAGVRQHSGNASTAGGHGWVVISWTAPPIPDPVPDPDPVPEPEPVPDPDAPDITESDDQPVAASVRQQPAPVALALAMPSGMTCTPLTDVVQGAWMRLPSAEECSDQTTQRSAAGALLGWATSSDFPVEIAQRQINNRWGAYELFNSAGVVTAVFIPAGGWTKASADTRLFPIWAPN